MKLWKQAWCLLLLAESMQSCQSDTWATSLEPVSPQQLVEQADLSVEGVAAEVQHRGSDVAGPDNVSLPHALS